MTKFRKLPVIVEAVRFTGQGDMPEVELTMLDSDSNWRCSVCGCIAAKHGNVKTLEGYHIACPQDWIITGIKGEHYPCKPDIFAETYEEVKSE